MQRASTYFSSFGLLPALKISAKDEEFSANLNDANALFLNDSAEMPHGKSCEFCGVGYVEKHPFRHGSCGGLHRFPPSDPGEMQVKCQLEDNV
jgi:hypothetical protein